MLRTTLALGGGLLGLLAFVSVANAAPEPPTEEAVQSKIERAMAFYRSKGDAFSLEDPEFHAVLDGELADVDPAECDLPKIMSMQMLWAYSPNAKPTWIARIREIGAEGDWLGAAGALAGSGDREAGMAMLDGRDLAAVEDERLGEAMALLSMMDDETLASMRGTLVAIGKRMPTEGAGELLAWSEFPAMLGRAGVDKADRDEMRSRLLGAMRAAAETADERGKARLDRTVAFLDGAAGRGELIGHNAPAVEFRWKSVDEPWHCFGCMKGKVVVVDFWATWCGPCVGSFPNVRELVDYYKGYDVVVLGVTSEQGNVIFRDERGRVETDSFEKECELMAEYVKAMDVTWPVAFTETDVFNPDFGVRGIPHVAIIAPDGKVAYNGMHPAGDMAEKVEKINGLLEKAGLKHPPAWTPKAEETEASEDAPAA